MWYEECCLSVTVKTLNRIKLDHQEKENKLKDWGAEGSVENNMHGEKEDLINYLVWTCRNHCTEVKQLNLIWSTEMLE